MLRAVSCIPIENPTSHPVVYRLASLGVEPSPGVSYDRFMHTGPGILHSSLETSSEERYIDKLERVQRRAIQLIPELRSLSYEDRVQQCKLTTLETRRVRGDQIEVFKITHGIEGLDSGMFFKYRTDNGTRGHSWALHAKERCKLDIRTYAFSQRTINEWNRLPGECVNATSVNMFKNKIDYYFKRSGYV